MQDINSSKVFNFEETFADLIAEKPKPRLAAPAGSGEQELLQALIAAGETAYRWDIATDNIVWSANVAEVLGCKPETIKTGRHFASMLDPENLTTRYETVIHSKERDLGNGVSFQIEYAFHSQAHQNSGPIHLEDSGHWQAGEDGAPKVVYGTLRRIDVRHAREQQQSFLGTSDPLTGMMNRGEMTEALSQAINGAQKSGAYCAFAIAVIDNLNLVNDAYGFDIADEVIIQISHRLRQVMRTGDGIARYSGSKFGFILNECNESELATALARFTATVRESVVETSKGPVCTTLSIGAVSLPQNGDTAAVAISSAEEALSDATRMAEDCSMIYKPSVRLEANREFNSRCATELVKCLGEESFRLAYQPIVDAQTRLPTMYEALLRLPQAEGQSAFSAAEIIPLAEHLGLAHLVDSAVLKPIIQALLENPNLRLNMNVSSSTVGDTYWQDQLLDGLSSHKAAAEQLTIEFSENVALAHLKISQRFIERLRDVGTSVAIDHFGQGYASVRHLRELPITLLKLDGTLCKNISAHPENEILVRSLLEATKKLGIKTVAEWIETNEDAQVLTRLGADYLQGHHLGQPSFEHDWLLEKPSASEPVQHQPVVTAQETKPQELPQEEPAIEINTVVSATKIEAPEVSSSPEFMAPLDFSAIDDSIAKLREALEGLNTSSSAANEDEASVHAA